MAHAIRGRNLDKLRDELTIKAGSPTFTLSVNYQRGAIPLDITCLTTDTLQTLWQRIYLRDELGFVANPDKWDVHRAFTAVRFYKNDPDGPNPAPIMIGSSTVAMTVVGRTFAAVGNAVEEDGKVKGLDEYMAPQAAAQPAPAVGLQGPFTFAAIVAQQAAVTLESPGKTQARGAEAQAQRASNFALEWSDGAFHPTVAASPAVQVAQTAVEHLRGKPLDSLLIEAAKYAMAAGTPDAAAPDRLTPSFETYYQWQTAKPNGNDSAARYAGRFESGNYTLPSFLQSMYYRTDEDSDSDRRFYRSAPVGYALMGAGPMAFFSAVEMVGKIFMTPASCPFFIGSPEHKAAAAALPNIDYAQEDAVLIRGISEGWLFDTSQSGVWWTSQPLNGKFYKIFNADAKKGGKTPMTSDDITALHKVYTRFDSICTAAADSLPVVLRHPHLIYGAFAFGVEMEYVMGRDATLADLTAESGYVLLQKLATGLVWLMRHGLVYTDVRPPNIRIVDTAAGLSVVLIDYDDMLIHPPIASAQAFKELLKAGQPQYQHMQQCFKAIPSLEKAVNDCELWS